VASKTPTQRKLVLSMQCLRFFFGESVVVALAMSLAGCGTDWKQTGSEYAGRNCSSDSACGTDGTCSGEPNGVCIVRAFAACSTDGSQAECPAGSRCWDTLSGDSYCWADCDVTCDTNGECDSFQSCVHKSSSSSGGSSGSGVGTSCSCYCSCSSCSFSMNRTCSPASSSCGSCASACASSCSSNSCGSSYGSSGSCS